MPSTVLSRMVKTAAFYLVPIKSYSKNTHPPFFLKRAIVNQLLNSPSTYWWRPTKCAVLYFLIKYLLCERGSLLKYAVCKHIDFPRTKNKSMCVSQLFLVVWGWLLLHKRQTILLVKNKTRVYGVLSSLFEHTKYSLETSWSIGNRPALKWNFSEVNILKLCKPWWRVHIDIRLTRECSQVICTVFVDTLPICRIW